MMTEMPAVLLNAIAVGGEVGVSVLTKWTARAHLSAAPGAEEAAALAEALHANPVRSRMAAHLAKHLALEDEGELHRLSRVTTLLQPNSPCAPQWIRTTGLRLRRPTLYPAELVAQQE